MTLGQSANQIHIDQKNYVNPHSVNTQCFAFSEGWLKGQLVNLQFGQSSAHAYRTLWALTGPGVVSTVQSFPVI